MKKRGPAFRGGVSKAERGLCFRLQIHCDMEPGVSVGGFVVEREGRRDPGDGGGGSSRGSKGG